MKNFSARVDWGFALNDAESGGRSVDVGNNEFYAVFTVLY